MGKKVRFGVRSEDARRTTNVWTCWAQAAKSDLYLTSDVLGKALKLSDHPTGRSHVAFHREKGNELFTAETLPSSRFILKRESDTDHAQQIWRLAACLSFPSGSLQEVPRVAHPETIWLPEAPAGQATQVNFFRFNVETLPNTWPGKREGSSLLAEIPLSGKGKLLIVWRQVDFHPPSFEQGVARGIPFKGHTVGELMDANRAVTFGLTDTGVLSLIEVPVVIQNGLDGTQEAPTF